ncbi:MAG TPA: hypothetical protein VGN61_11970 [Verrucomicrobiae bacterium]
MKNRWHGYPVGWKEVPATIRKQFMETKLVSAREIKRYWEDVL